MVDVHRLKAQATFTEYMPAMSAEYHVDHCIPYWEGLQCWSPSILSITVSHTEKAYSVDRRVSCRSLYPILRRPTVLITEYHVDHYHKQSKLNDHYNNLSSYSNVYSRLNKGTVDQCLGHHPSADDRGESVSQPPPLKHFKFLVRQLHDTTFAHDV